MDTRASFVEFEYFRVYIQTIYPLHMKRFVLSVALMCLAGTPLSAQNYKPSPENLENRRQFAADRFGIFIHWGIYSLFAQGEWYLQDGPLRREEYAKAANAFYPHDFDANAWAKVFKKAGARYVTFTTRHHDGFSMWNTRQSDYNIMHNLRRLVVRTTWHSISIIATSIGCATIILWEERADGSERTLRKPIGRIIMLL